MTDQQLMRQMEEALTYLSRIFPDDDNTIGLQVTQFGGSGFHLPSFVASSNNGAGYSESVSPMRAVKSLLRLNRITTVEQYIRINRSKP